MMPECKAVSGSFAVQIRPIAVPTGPGAVSQGPERDEASIVVLDFRAPSPHSIQNL
jgi:hypothetical protein